MVKSTLPILLLLLFSLNTTAAPLGGNPPSSMPGGDYQNVCKKCSYDSKTGILACHCPDHNGQRHLATLDLSTCTTRRVELKMGYLFCNNISKDLEKKSVKKPDQLSERIVKPESLEEGGREAVKSSGGDYQNYCNNCSEINGRLECDCWVSLGWTKTLSKTSISLDRCPKSDITYAKGSLICQKHLSNILNNNSCKNCRVQGNQLKCICPKTPCQWSQEDLNKGLNEVPAQLATARFCTKTINNCNGVLRCGRCGSFDYQDEHFRPHEGTSVRPDCLH